MANDEAAERRTGRNDFVSDVFCSAVSGLVAVTAALASGLNQPIPRLPPGFFCRPAPDVAPDLIGTTLLIDGVGGLIVETEAYDRTDPASHSYRGPTLRNAAMFGPAGHLYVYRSYGLHWCLNMVCDDASAVLIRALAPACGIDAMMARRGVSDPRLLCSGPGRLCQALGVTRALDGASLHQPPLTLLARTAPVAIAAGPRIGITKGATTPWRFGAAGSRFLSRRLPELS